MRYLSGGRGYSYEETAELLRSPDPFERVRAWEMLRGGWAGLEGELAGLLGRAFAARKNLKAAEVFGEDSGRLLEAASSLRAPLSRALEVKAGRVGSPGFRCCDLRARLPAPADAQMPLAEGLRRLGAIFDGAVEGGRGLIMEFFPGNRLLLEGERPQCLQPAPSAPAVVCLPESFRGVYPSDLPVIAHELGHAIHSDIAARVGAGCAPLFDDMLSHFFEDITWAGLTAEADPAAAAELVLNRLPQMAADFLLVPAGLELEEEAVSAAAAGPLTGEAMAVMEKKVLLKWLGPDTECSGFWMRSADLFRPERPFSGFRRLAGRFLSPGLSAGGGRLSSAGLEELAADTGSLDLKRWLAKRAPGGWSGLASGVLAALPGLD